MQEAGRMARNFLQEAREEREGGQERQGAGNHGFSRMGTEGDREKEPRKTQKKANFHEGHEGRQKPKALSLSKGTGRGTRKCGRGYCPIRPICPIRPMGDHADSRTTNQEPSTRNHEGEKRTLKANGTATVMCRGFEAGVRHAYSVHLCLDMLIWGWAP